MGFFDKLANVFGITTEIPNQDETDIGTLKENNLLVTVDEFKQIVDETRVPEKKFYNVSANELSSFMLSMLKEEYDKVSARIVDARRLKKIFPEFEDATDILVSSILSPNNFLQFDLNFKIMDDSISDKEKSSIIKIIKEHFNENFKLQDKLDTWLHQIIGETGSKPVLVLPYSTILKLKQANVTNISFESLEHKLETYSFRKIYSNPNKYENGIINKTKNVNISTEQLEEEIISNCIEQDKDLISDIMYSLESLASEIDNSKKEKLTKTINGKKTTIFKTDSNVIIKELKNYFKTQKISSKITFIEDPTFSIVNGVIRTKNKQNIEKTLDEVLLKDSENIKNIQYKDEKFLDIGPYLVESEEYEHGVPLVLELPSEAVIPLTTPGNPSSHIGYFIIFNQYGEPVTNYLVSDDDLLKHVNREDTLVNKLYRTMYSKNFDYGLFFGNDFVKHRYLTIMKKVYSTYIEKLLAKNLEDIGIYNVELNITNNILNLMLSRILSHKKTFILFVPESLLTYFALNYDEHGIGISKIEQVKLIAALRMTYIITRLLSQMEDSINTKRIEIAFDESIPNPLELAKEIRQELINNRIFNFSYEPSQILKTLLEKEINIIPRNIPGVQNFDVNVESVQRGKNRPDSDLLEELNNMSVIGLSIPPSVFNQLKESEYSRTVATNNIFFSLKINKHQKHLISLTNKFIRVYIKYYPKLREQLKESLRSFLTTKDDLSDKDKEEYLENKLTNIINSLTITLPSPKISHDKAIGEEMRNYADIIDTIADRLFPDGVVKDDLRDQYDMYKNIFKMNMMKQFLDKTNAGQEFDINTAKEVDIEQLIDMIKYLKNIDKLSEDLLKAYENNPEGEEGY